MRWALRISTMVALTIVSCSHSKSFTGNQEGPRFTSRGITIALTGATPAPTPTSPSTHIGTIDYSFSGSNAQGGVYPTPFASVLGTSTLSMVEVGEGGRPQASHYHAVGVKTYQYTDANIAVCLSPGWTGTPTTCNTPENSLQSAWMAALGTTTSSNYVHDCLGNNLYVGGHPRWLLLDPVNTYPLFASVWGSAGGNIDYMYIDGTGPIGPGLKQYGTGGMDWPCYHGTSYNIWQQNVTYVELAWQNNLPNAATTILCNCLGGDSGLPYYRSNYPFGLNSSNAGDIPPGVTILKYSAGGKAEGAYIQNGCCNTKRVWQGVENMEIVSANSNKVFNAKMYDHDVDPTSSTGQHDRLFGLASLELTYNLGYTYYMFFQDQNVCWPGTRVSPSSKNPYCEHTYPESQFVAWNPFVALPANSTTNASGNGIQALQSSNGTYYREYKDCFYKGTRLGRCVVDVNPDTVPHPWPRDSELTEDYTTTATGRTPKQIILNNGPGAEIDSGGTAAFTGGPAPSTVPADTGIIVVDTTK